MRYSQTDHGYERIATLDVETTQNNPTVGKTVSNGIGVHHRVTSSNEASDELSHRNNEFDAEDTYIDLIEGRKRVTPRRAKWPWPAECLESYGFDVPVTMLEGPPVTNTRFGEELGLTYLRLPGEC